MGQALDDGMCGGHFIQGGHPSRERVILNPYNSHPELVSGSPSLVRLTRSRLGGRDDSM
jgi:hypothetical protein